MNDDRARCAVPRRGQVLVVPAAVPEPRLAREQIRIPVRIVVHDQQDLALEIGILEIVPVVFRRLDAVTDEDDLGARDLGARSLVVGIDHEFVPLPERHRTAVPFEGPSFRHQCVHADEIERLFPAAVGGAGLEPKLAHAPGEILACFLVAGACRPTAFVLVARDLGDDLANELAGD